MDQDTKKPTDQEQPESTTEMIEAADEDSVKPPEPVEKQTKGGGGLALLLSLVALLAVAYLYYLDWQGDTTEPPAGVDASEIQVWQDEQEKVASELQNVKADIQSLQQITEQLQQQVSQQQQVLAQRDGAAVGGGTETLAFDNSPNEQAIKQLQQAIAGQSRLIQSLQQGLLESNEPVQSIGPMGSALATSQAEMQRQAAIQTVLAVKMMVDSQRIPAAIDTLEQFNQHLNTDVDLQQRMSALAATLRQADLPDLVTAKTSLAALAQAIDQLKVPTIETDEERAWYEKLVSIKKIDDQSPITSTAELMTLKMQLKQHVYEARLNLNLGQASGWQQTLNEAASLVQQQLPNQPSLAQSFRQLAQQSITPQLPAAYDIEATLTALKGS